MSKLQIKTGNYWCHHVYKVEKGGKPFIACLLRRKYGDDFEDIDDSGTAELMLGLESKPKKRMIWDNDPDSETFQQRIEDPNDEGGEMIHSFTIPMTDEIVSEISKMCGESAYAGTQYFWLFHGKTPIQADSLDELVSSHNIDIIREEQGKKKISRKAVKKDD